MQTRSRRRNPNWTEVELALALEAYLEIAEKGESDGPDNPRIIALSRLLNDLPFHPVEVRTPTFRDPAGVARRFRYFRKLENGESIGGRAEYQRVWDRYRHHRDALQEAVGLIAQGGIPAGLQSESDLVGNGGRHFGPILGVEPGQLFPDRRALSQAGVHRPTQAGISGSAEEGADSIVLSGGYEDDEDLGDVIIYTGHGGQDPNSREQVRDQELTRQNLALAVSMQQGLPVRVTRGAAHRSEWSPEAGYRYTGIYRVTSFWHDRGRSGYNVWRFRLEKVPSTESSTSTSEESRSSGNQQPSRKTSTVTRVVRDTTLSKEVKARYDHTCQVCNIQLRGPAGPYAEAAHIRPLGRPHDGPDTPDNILVLCPNHHFLFDVGAFGVAEDFSLIGLEGVLTVRGNDKPRPDYLDYHRNHFGLKR